MIESGPATGLDEHPINNIQVGAKYISTFISALMSSAALIVPSFCLTMTRVEDSTITCLRLPRLHLTTSFPYLSQGTSLGTSIATDSECRSS